ncbi:hypothetical protein EDC18_102403 [Natranaerovirga pectinivora]|uniref:Uncharacterized protein n=1 Tax=Natranaerovirga pectinivora TaxID=682400 RepID=A0A4R3MTJ3_9FIRM|nr:hypothetical protein [Natranaerovirga pectinivora]TCT16384.1 hypothetical protein EDC18_102403 [Natranaerovirga pectinivora]
MVKLEMSNNKITTKEVSLIEYLEEADYDVQCRVDYISRSLAAVEDSMLETTKMIEESKVDLEVAVLVGSKKKAIKRHMSTIRDLEEQYKYLCDELDALEDLYEIEIINVMA